MKNIFIFVPVLVHLLLFFYFLLPPINFDSENQLSYIKNGENHSFKIKAQTF